METIKVSDETYNFLKNLAKEMKEQNNRGTQNVAFVIHNKQGSIIGQEGIFLTAKACDELIQRKKYNYGESARSYGISCYMNNEMTRLQEAIFEIADIEKPNYY